LPKNRAYLGRLLTIRKHLGSLSEPAGLNVAAASGKNDPRRIGQVSEDEFSSSAPTGNPCGNPVHPVRLEKMLSLLENQQARLVKSSYYVPSNILKHFFVSQVPRLGFDFDLLGLLLVPLVQETHQRGQGGAQPELQHPGTTPWGFRQRHQQKHMV